MAKLELENGNETLYVIPGFEDKDGRTVYIVRTFFTNPQKKKTNCYKPLYQYCYPYKIGCMLRKDYFISFTKNDITSCSPKQQIRLIYILPKPNNARKMFRPA